MNDLDPLFEDPLVEAKLQALARRANPEWHALLDEARAPLHLDDDDEAPRQHGKEANVDDATFQAEVNRMINEQRAKPHARPLPRVTRRIRIDHVARKVYSVTASADGHAVAEQELPGGWRKLRPFFEHQMKQQEARRRRDDALLAKEREARLIAAAPPTNTRAHDVERLVQACERLASRPITVNVTPPAPKVVVQAAAAPSPEVHVHMPDEIHTIPAEVETVAERNDQDLVVRSITRPIKPS